MVVNRDRGWITKSDNAMCGVYHVSDYFINHPKRYGELPRTFYDESNGPELYLIYDYVDWLKTQYVTPVYNGNTYHYLIKALCCIPYIHPNDMDDDIAASAMWLRFREYLHERRGVHEDELRKVYKLLCGNHAHSVFADSAVSMFEVMIYQATLFMRALEGCGYRQLGSEDKWFWVFIKNMGLVDCYDDAWSYNKYKKVSEACERWFHNEYEEAGIGSMVPSYNISQNEDIILFKDVGFIPKARAYIRSPFFDEYRDYCLGGEFR